MTQSLAVRTEGLGSDLIGHSSVGGLLRPHEGHKSKSLLDEASLRAIAVPVMATQVDIDRLHITTELL